MTVYVVEGPEGSGKTTLAKSLAEKLGLEYFHTGGSQMPEEEWWPFCLALLKKKDVVFDRFPSISELVYPAVMGRPARATRVELCQLWTRLNPAMVVYCRPAILVRPLEEKAHKSEAEQLETVSRLDAIQEEYDRLFRLPFFSNHRRFNFQKDTF